MKEQRPPQLPAPDTPGTYVSWCQIHRATETITRQVARAFDDQGGMRSCRVTHVCERGVVLFVTYENYVDRELPVGEVMGRLA